MIEQQVESDDDEQAYQRATVIVDGCLRQEGEAPVKSDLDFAIFEKPLGKLCNQIRAVSEQSERVAIAKASLVKTR